MATSKSRPSVPDSVAEALRREVNFGCPVEGCGSPFLTWHHFDPPWRQEEHFRPEGMIALCARHAPFADGSSYTNNHLRGLKAKPFVQQRAEDWLPWQPEAITFMMGGAVAFEARKAVRLSGVDVFSAHRTDGGHLKLDANLMGPDGDEFLTMKDSWISVRTGSLRDLHGTTQARNIDVEHRSGVRMRLRWDRFTVDEFRSRVAACAPGLGKRVDEVVDLGRAHGTDSDGLIPVISVTGKFWSNGVHLRLTSTNMRLRIRGVEEVVSLSPILPPGGAVNFVRTDPRTGVETHLMSFG